MNKPESNQALTKALDLLSKRSYSKAILRDKLRDKDFSAENVELAISKLISLGFLDDKKYAESLVREYSEFKRYGAYRIKLKLIEKKISDEIIKEALDKISKDTEQENIIELVKKYLKNKNLPREKLYNRTLGFLLRRGYSYELSKKAVSELIKNS